MSEQLLENEGEEGMRGEMQRTTNEVEGRRLK